MHRRSRVPTETHHLANSLQSLCFIFDASDNKRFFQNLFNIHKGRQRAVRILLNVTNFKTIVLHFFVIELREIFSIKYDLTACGNIEAEDRFHEARLPASRLTDHCHCFPFSQLKADAIHSLDFPHAAKSESAQFIPHMQIIYS